MKTKAEKYTCSNCGSPFHGLTACPEDSPAMLKANFEKAVEMARIETSIARIREIADDPFASARDLRRLADLLEKEIKNDV